MATYLDRARQAVDIFAVIITPLVLAALAAVVLAVPAQEHEVYRAIALNVGVYPEELENYAQLLGSLLAVLALGTALYLASCILLASFGPKPSSLKCEGRGLFVFLPIVVGIMPLAGIALGLFHARSTHWSAGTDDAGLRDRLTQEVLSIVGQGENPSPEFVTAAQKTVDQVFSVGLGDDLWWGGIGIALIALLFAAALYLARNAIAKSPFVSGDRTLQLLLGAALLTSTIVLVIVLFPVAVPEAMGSTAIISVFFIVLLLWFGTVSYFSRELRFPFTVLLLLYVTALSISGCNDNHRIRSMSNPPKPDPSQGVQLPSLQSELDLWYHSRPDGKRYKKYPLYLVAAQGGGIYAAHQTAVFLASAHQTVPAFQHHLFAISSVSGGSVGAAIFASALDAADAMAQAGEAAEQAKPHFDVVNFVDESVLSRNLWAPLVAGLSFPDFLQRFVPRPLEALDRARALERGLENAWDAGVTDYEERYNGFRGKSVLSKFQGEDNQSLLVQSYLAHWDPQASRPALLINTTEVTSGRRRVFAPFQFDPEDLQLFPPEIARTTSLSTAAVLSARFPWVTPAGWFESTEHTGQNVRVVDGGYFEASGVATALQLRDAILRAAAKLDLADKIDVRIIALTGGNAADPQAAAGGLNEVADPIRTLLTTWSARGDLSVREAERRLDGDLLLSGDPPLSSRHLLRVTLRPIRYALPLGWTLSDPTRLLIRVQRGVPARCAESSAAASQGKHQFPADCVVAEIARELH